ncbi:glycosyltransferase family 2 protein [Thiomonas sp. FB-Cd]|uniref:glycosyltransferase family 2 protein n=1 Tax=Thiomonas sp. FB-Cd TaxID=1158292 RepID=UPI00350FBF33
MAQTRLLHAVSQSWSDFVAGSSGNRPALDALARNRSRNAERTHAPREADTIDVSVVTYNSERWIAAFMTSLLAQDYPTSRMNLMFVDHGSHDGTVDILRSMQERFRARFAGFTLLQQENKGFGAGHDHAVRASKSDLILISNVDLEFRADSLSRVIAVARADADHVAAWELRQLPFEHPKHYDPVTLETNWQSHACVLMRRDAYLRVGGYEPKIFMYGEDVELSYRLRSYGYTLRYVPSAAVIHHSYADEATLLKALQYTGSTLANLLIRLRYGTVRDVLIGFMLYLGLLFRLRQPFPGVRRVLVRNLAYALRHIAYFKRGRGTAPAHFPFRAFDFELRREGAACRCEIPSEIQRVTVITRTYETADRAMLLAQCGSSVANQTYPDIEWLVVQDGPGSSARGVVERVAARAPWLHTRFIECPPEGRSHAGNEALKQATGAFCMFLDDDDLLYADHVESLYVALEKEAGATAAYALSFEVRVADDGGARVDGAFSTPSIFRQPWDYDVLLDHNFIPIQSILFKRELFRDYGGFARELDQLEDWNLWLRYGYRNRFVYLQKTTSIFYTPIRAKDRLRRHLALHQAYIQAKEHALDEIEKRGLGDLQLPRQQDRRFGRPQNHPVRCRE